DRAGKLFHQGVHGSPPSLFASALARDGGKRWGFVVVRVVMCVIMCMIVRVISVIVSSIVCMFVGFVAVALPGLEELLDRRHAHLLGLDQALQMLARVEQSLG